MRTLAAIFALLAFALPATAGPIDSWQYRTTLSAQTIWGPDTLPSPWPGERPYLMGFSPMFGVIARDTPDWSTPSPAYPSANFALIHPGALTPYIEADQPPFPDVGGSGRYYLNLDIRDADGR